MSWDPYLDLEYGVLRNRLRITDHKELARAEAALTASRLVDLQHDPLPDRFDLRHLRSVHRCIFQDVYIWAGKLRTVSIGKGGRVFCLPQHLVGDATKVFDRLAADNQLCGRGRESFLDGATELLCDINALHPFREGNGRAQRAFLAQVARGAGHRIRWVGLDPLSNIAASRASHDGDLTLLRELLDLHLD